MEPRVLLSADGFSSALSARAAVDDHRFDETPAVEMDATVQDRAGATVQHQSRAAGAGEEASLFDVETVSLLIGDEGSDAGGAPDRPGQNDAARQDPATPVVSEDATTASDVFGAPETAADEGSAIVFDALTAGPTTAAQDTPSSTVEVGSQVDGSVWPGILIETLNAANGPPVADAVTMLPGGGRLFHIDPENAETFGSELVVNEGDILMGTGAPGLSVINNGSFRPGHSPEITVVNTFNQGAGGELEIEIGGVTPGAAGHDQLQVTNGATLNGLLRIKLINSFVPALGQTFTVVTWGSRPGALEFENYLGTAEIGGGLAFVPVYTPGAGAGNLTLQVVATPNYNPVKPQVEDLIDTLGEVGNVLDTVGNYATELPYIGDSVGSLVDTGKSIRDVLLDKLNDLAGPGTTLADVTAWLEDLDGQTVLGHTMHVEGVLGVYGATVANPFSWNLDVFFSHTETFTYDLGSEMAFGATLTGATTGSVTSRFDLDFTFGKDATGYYVQLHETKAKLDLNVVPAFGVSLAAPVSASAAVLAGSTVAFHAEVCLFPKVSSFPGGKLYLNSLEQLRDGSLSLITNFDYVLNGTIAVDLRLSLSGLTLGGGLSVTTPENVRLQINGLNLFTEAPSFDLTVPNATLTLGGGLPNLTGSFRINVDGALTYLEADAFSLLLEVGPLRLGRFDGSGSFVLGDSTLAGKADVVVGNPENLPGLTLNGGVWHLEFNTGADPAVVPYDGGTATVPGGPYVRVEADGVELGVTAGGVATALTGNFVFEKAGTNILVGASDATFGFDAGGTDLLTIAGGSGAFALTPAGLAGTMTGTLSEEMPLLDVGGVLTIDLNTTGAAVNQTVSVGGETILIDIASGNYLRIEGLNTTVALFGITLTGNFVYENRNTTTGGEKVIAVAVTNLTADLGLDTADVVSLTNGSGAFFITGAGLAGTASITYALDVPGLTLTAAGTATLTINQTNVAVNETIPFSGGDIPVVVPPGPYLRVDTVGASFSLLGSSVSGNFSYEEATSEDGSEVVRVAASNVAVELKAGATPLLSFTGGSGLFLFNDDGMAGTATGTLTESVLDLTGLASASGTFALTINNTGEAVDEEFIIGGSPVTLSAPAGPYLKIAGDEVNLTMDLGGIGGATVHADFAFEQKSDTNGDPEYVKVGATEVDIDLVAGGVTVRAVDGEGGFILTGAGIAGEATIGTLSLLGTEAFLAIGASEVVLRLNSTNADVPETTVATSITDDRTFEFEGLYYRNYIGIAGAVEVNLLNFADFSGNVAFELYNPGSGNVIRLAANDLEIEFKLGAAGPSLLRFHHGTGGFILTNGGLAGTAALEFETGFVAVSGSIILEVNTFGTAQSAAWTAPDDVPYSFNLTGTNYLQVCVFGNVIVASVTVPVDFTVVVNTGGAGDADDLLVFQTKEAVPQVMFTLSQSGGFTPGPYWSTLALPPDLDFANPSPEDILVFLQRLGNWFSLFQDSSLFNVQIPFTDGKTLRDAFDWSAGFIDLLYARLITTEIAPTTVTLPAAGAYNGSFKITLGATVKTVNFAGNWSTGLDGLAAAINAGLAVPGVALSARVEARINRDGKVVVALTEAEIEAQTLQFSISAGTGAWITAGFSATSNSQTVSRYTIEQFPYAVSRVIGIAGSDPPTIAEWPHDMDPPAPPAVVVSDTPIIYDPTRKLYVFPISFDYAPTPFSVPFDFGADLGPLGSATLSGNVRFAPTLHFGFNLGLDLNAGEVPRIMGSQFLPAPSNGRISADLSFKLYINGSAAPITVSLAKSAADNNTTRADLAADLNAALGAAADYISPTGATVDLRQLVVFQAAGQILVLSVIQEDLDGDGHRDLVNEDLDNDHVIDAGEDVDGDGYLDVVETDLNSDGDFDNQLGLINQIRLTTDKNSVLATELGFGDELRDPNAGLGYPDGYYESTANSSMRGFFIEEVALNASLTITTPVAITGKIVFGFVSVEVLNGRVRTTDPYTNTPNPIALGIGIRDPTTGNDRFYLDELMDVLNDLGTYIDGPNLTGSVYAGFQNITAKIGGQTIINGGEISVWIPDITVLTLNENAYNVTDLDAGNDTGIFLTYPEIGLQGGYSFEKISFTDIIQALQAVVETLDDFSAFSFLNEKIPFIDVSLHDLVDYAAKFADLVEAVSGSGSDDIQSMLDEMEAAIEDLFHLDPATFSITLDTNGIDYSNTPGVTDVILTGGGPGVSATVTFNPNGNNNAFSITADVNGTGRNNNVLRVLGDASVSGNLATATWDPVAKIITILIDPANTTAQTIVNAINSQIGAAWTAATVADGAGTPGAGTVRTNSLKFHWKFTTAYANQLPFQLDLAKLVAQLGGDNPAVASFLEAASNIIHVQGSGLLNVSASAEATLDFGLDLTNPNGVTPFIYDSTGVDLKAKVTATNLDFEAAIGALGVFIRDGEVIFDYDGKGGSTESASIHLGLKNSDGDGRHYFDSSLLSLDTIEFTAHGGVTAILPLYAPVEAIPIGSTADQNGDGYADNALVADIPDLVRLLTGDTTSKNSAGQEEAFLIFRGDKNDLKLTVTAATAGVKVIFLNDPTVPASSPTATYNAGAKELTFRIRSGLTTAQQLISATAGTLAANGFTMVLAGGDGVPVNGSGPIAKMSLIAPDLNNLFADLSLCEIISSATGPMLDALDGTLGDIQQALEEVVLDTDLPLLGDGLKGAATFIEDFRNGLLAELRARIAAANGDAIGAVEDAIKEAFWRTLGPDGLDLLVDPVSGTALDESEGFDQLDITLDCDNGLYANLRLAASLALLDTTKAPIDFDIGVPGFGLEVQGNVVLAIGFDLKLRFGYNKTDGFFLGTAGGIEDPELKLEFSATIPGLRAEGELFFLQLEVSDDPDAPSSFTGGFYVDLRDPNNDGKLTWSEITSSGTDFEDIIHGELAAEADINLNLVASFGGNTSFPRILADFHLGWSWSLSEGAGDPEIEFGNINLDLGSFISDVLGPILDKIKEVTEPLDPVLEIVTTPLPVLSELAGKDITFLDLAEGFGYLDPGTRQFIEQVLKVIDIINDIPTGEGSILIPIGTFGLLSGGSGNYDQVNPLGNLSNIDLDEAINSVGTGSTASSTQITQTSGFVGDEGLGSLSNFSFPFLQNPSELFGLFVGNPVRLVEWQMPTFKFEFTYVQKIPIYPPLYAQFGGKIGATINIGFGYDSAGIQEFITNGAKNPAEIFNGFYIADFDANGNERPELVLEGEIFAGVSINLGVVEVGVNGGINATIEFDLNDVVDDGRIRVSELIANAQQDPRCIFDIHGALTLFLEAFLKVDLFFFSIDKTWRFAEITLFEFDITCPEPVLASVSANTLFIHIGTRAGDRQEIDTADGDETFVITTVSGGAGSESVSVAWGHYKQEFSGFTKIVADAGDGNDYLDFRGVLTKTEVTMGSGNDQLFLGLGASSTANGDGGNDTITLENDDQLRNTNAVIHGGDGNDVIVPGMTAVTFYGDGGTDTLTGSNLDDTLDGGEGSDTITGNAGDDTIAGGSGNDTIDAGEDDDTVDAGEGNDVVEAGEGHDRVTGGSGNDVVYASVGNDIVAGGAGDDQLFGHGGNDLLVGDDFDYLAVAFDLSTAATAAGSFPVLNITGSGNDMVIGGGGYDLLFGGDGDDFVFGGNYFDGGNTGVVEDDDNDFIDGGRGDDELFGDDSFGKPGDRVTGIEISSVVFQDVNNNGVYDDGDRGLGGVKVELFKASDDSSFTETVSDSAGRFKLGGLDPLDYYIVFTAPAGYTPAALQDQGAGGALSLDDPAESSADSDVNGAGRTAAFQMDFDEIETTITAGFFGAPGLTITTAAVREGESGQTTKAVFNFVLSNPSPVAITVQYRTVDGGATAADNDYEPLLPFLLLLPRTLTFNAGETTKVVSVTINGDATYEDTEDFDLRVDIDAANLAKLKAGTPASQDITSNIVNDDGAPELSVTDVIVDEPAGGTTTAQFKVRLTNPHEDGVKVSYITTNALTVGGEPAERSATAIDDYVPKPATVLSFGPGEVEKIVTVTIKGDAVDEYDETFYLNLFNPENARISDDRGFGIIVESDDEVTVAITPVLHDDPLPANPNYQRTSVFEGNNTSQQVNFNITLSGPTGKSVVVTWDAARGTAVATVPTGSTDPVDFQNLVPSDASEAAVEAATTVTFVPGGPLTQTVAVWVEGDSVDESDEFFYVNLLDADGAEIAQNHGVVRIIDDDTGAADAPSPYDVRFARSDFQVNETDGPTTGTITLVRSSAGIAAYTVVTITGGTALNTPAINADYSSAQRFLVFLDATETVKVVDIAILGDNRHENDETINFSLRSPTGAPVSGSPGSATLTIIDDDDVKLNVVSSTTIPANFAALSTLTASTGIVEGNGPVKQHRFVVYLVDAVTLEPTETDVTVPFSYETRNVTARVADGDYTGIGLTPSTLDAGNPFRVITVDALGDALPEFIETFLLQATSPGNTFYHRSAEGIILDDDKTAVSGRIFKDTNANGYQDSGETGFSGVHIEITDSAGNVVTDTTGAAGNYSVNVLLGDLKFRVDEAASSPALNGWEVTSDNDSQDVEFVGGLSPLTDVGYRLLLNFTLPETAETAGRGGTDDTIFGGPGDDLIDAGAGDDHVIGGHWQTATDTNTPINNGLYNATVVSNIIGTIVNPQTAPIWTVDTTGLGPRSISGQIWVDTNNSNVQDEGLYLSEVVVTVLDCSGNIIQVQATSDGSYSFSGLYAGTYVVEFELPDNQQFVDPGVGGPAVNNDVTSGGRTALIDLTVGSASNIDAGLEAAGTAPAASSTTIQFAQKSWYVAEDEGSVQITILRTNASTTESVVWFAHPKTATSPTNYIASQGVASFGVGETMAVFEIPIVDTNSLGLCADALTFSLSLRKPTGQPIRGGTANVYIQGAGAGANTDNDTIFGGGDWDVILGDSGIINANAIPALASIVAGQLVTVTTARVTDSGGLGHDVIYGDDGPDYISAQLGDDLVAGGEGTDAITAGYGDDTIIAELDDDAITGAHGRDTLEGQWDGPLVYLTPGLLQFSRDSVLDISDSEFTFASIEVADLRGGASATVFRLNGWNSEAFIFGNDGSDTLEVASDVATQTLKDATAAQKALYASQGRTGLQANLTLSTGEAYHFGQLENVVLTGGPGANTIDASGYSAAASLEGLGGDDTLIGGAGANTFLFRGSNLGLDTITGNGGIDTLDFSTQTDGITVNLSTLGAATPVNGSVIIVSLVFTANDLEAVTGGSGNDVLTGNSLHNILLGGPGDDTLTGLAGSETYRYDTDTAWGSDTIVESSGDAGFDTIDFSTTTTQSITLNLGLPTVQPVNVNLSLTITGDGVESVIGGSLGDTISGNARPNYLIGGPGDDVLFGAQGADFLDGGDGTDVLDGGVGNDYIAVTANSNITLTDAQVLRNGGDVDHLNGIERAFLTGGTSNNLFTLTGWSGDAVINGAGGTDRLAFQADADLVLTGAAGSDTLTITDPDGTSTFILLSVERYTLTGGVGDNLIDASGYASGGLLTLSGSAGDDQVIGSPGGDTLLGGTGDDTLTGNGGFDTVNGGDGLDAFDETRSGGVIVTAAGLTWGGVAETDLLSSVESFSFTGTAAVESMVILGLPAGLGSITFDGGGGNDLVAAQWNGSMTLTNTALTLVGNPVAITLVSVDRALLAGGPDDDVINAAGFSGPVFLNGAAGDDIVTGGGGADGLSGGEGDDTLRGNGGNDTLDGGAGDDTYLFNTGSALGTDSIVDAGGIDTLDFSASPNAVTVNLSLLNQVVNANLSLGWLAAVAIENAIGGSAADSLTGNALDNTLTGNGGVDTLNGATGTDTVAETRDLNMTLTNATLTIGAEGVDTLVSIEAARLTGGPGANALNALAFTGKATLEGRDGADTLTGGSGDDTLIGGLADDTLAGNGGNDTYVFDGDLALGSDSITDTAGSDTLDFSPTGTGVTVSLGLTSAQTVTATHTLTLSAANQIENLIGGSGHDLLAGNGLVNRLTGGLGADTLTGTGNDILVESGDAHMSLTAGTLTIGGVVDTITGFTRAELTGGASNNTINATGFAGLAILRGGEGNDMLTGGSGGSQLFGEAGDDTLTGGGGSDLIDGGDGEDTLDGRGGVNSLAGGNDDDLYLFDVSVASTNTVNEIVGGGLHDQLLGAGGALVDLTDPAVQTPDAAHPSFTIHLPGLNLESTL